MTGMKMKLFLLSVAVISLASCERNSSDTLQSSADTEYGTQSNAQENDRYRLVNAETSLEDVISHPAFEGFGQHVLPTENGIPDMEMKIRDLNTQFFYHQNIDTATSVQTINAMIELVDKGETIFYDIYSEEEKAKNPEKKILAYFSFGVKQRHPLP